MSTETADERRARQLREYGHDHDRAGHPLYRIGLQDASEPGCPDCGLTAPEPWAHALDCPQYSPHPQSIAAQLS